MTVWQEIADRVWVRRYDFFDQTIGVIGGDAGLLVIDTRSSQIQGHQLLSELGQLPGALRWVVNTHTIDVGGREVEMHHLGRGHTDTDIVLAVPSVGVLFAGDLLENGAAPYFGDGYPLDWPATLEALIALSSGVVVPGHGDVADVAFARRSLEQIQVIADLGREVAAAGLSLEDAVARAPYRPVPARAAIERAAAQARGELDAG